VQKLAANASALRDELTREGFDARGSRTQIVPLVIGDPNLAVRICEAGLAGGVFAQAIRPPTVPANTSRLRLAVMASHHEEELRAAARTIARAVRAAGFEPRTLPAAVDEAQAEPAADRERGDERHDEPEPQTPARASVFDFEAPETRAA